MLAQRDSQLEAALSVCISGRIGQPVHAFQRVGSTMELAHALAAAHAPEGTLIWAARQVQGRGRLGRTWVSPLGGVYLSLILRPVRPPADIPQLSLVAGLSTAEAITELTGLFPSIRWPNDLLLNEKKVSGILVEAKVPGTFPASKSAWHFSRFKKCLAPYAVIGIGINVTTDPHELPETATSVSEAGAPGCDPYRLTGALCRHFQSWYDVWTGRGFVPIREALHPWMDHFGQPVHISAGASNFEGTASDLDEQGRLLVRLDSGIVQPFEMGEVTLLR